ncbi:hypothetical protein [Salana multivorans]
MKATDELATSTPGAADDAAGHTGVRRDTRSLRLATTLLWLVALGGLAQVALSLWFIVTGRLLFALGEGANPYLRLDRLPQLMQADLREGSDGIRLVELDWWIRALAWLPSVLIGVSLALGAWWGIRVLREIGAGRPFTAPVLGGLRRTGLVLSLGGIAAGLVDVAANAVFAYTMTGIDRESSWSSEYQVLGFTGGQWPLALIVVGVVCLAAGIAFRDGARLAEEADGVV